MKKNVFLLLTFTILIAFNHLFAQDWIDKNESQNYVKRHECSFVQSGNKFIMFGGREQAKRLDIYDYDNNNWFQGAQAPLEFNHFQALEYDGLIWVIGAFKTNNFPNEVPVENIYIYNPALNIWLEGPSIPANRRRGGAGVVLYENKFYLIAGNTQGHNGGYIPWLDAYDPLNNNWEQLPDAPRSRDHFSAAIIDNKIYAASGRLSGGPGGTFAPLIPQVDIYDLVSMEWSTLNSNNNLPTPRAGASVVTFEEELFVIGGEGANAGPAFKKVEAYNPLTNSWSAKSNMNFARHGTQAIVSGQGIHIAGGSPKRGGGRQHNMEVYNSDAPVGNSIQASTLNAIAEVVFDAPNQTKSIAITSSGGNAGNFITNVNITGPNSSNFQIQNNLFKHLIKSGTSQNITILANTSSNNETANLVITYDDGKVINVILSTPNSDPNPNPDPNPDPDPNPTPDPTPAIPIGSYISLRKSGGDKLYVAAENNKDRLIADRSQVGAWEKFLVETHPDGDIALKALANNLYVTVPNANPNIAVKPRGANKGSKERFEWKSMGNGKVAFKSIYSGKWLQAAWNENRGIVRARGNASGTWETFNWKEEVVISNRQNTALATKEKLSTITLHPNPADKVIHIEIPEKSFVIGATLNLHDNLGRILKSTSIKKYNKAIDISDLPAGIYFIKILNGKELFQKTFVKQ